MKLRNAFICAASALAFSPLIANATLIGDDIDGTLSSPDTALNSIDFDFGTFTVGAGDDASAGATDVFDQTWIFTLDVMAEGFTLAIDAPGQPNANIDNPDGVARIDLFDLDWTDGPGAIVGLSLLDYSCEPAGFPCDTFSGGPSVSDSGFGPDSLFITLSTLRTGELYTFGIDARHDIPTPAPLALIAAGLIGFGASRLRRR